LSTATEKLSSKLSHLKPKPVILVVEREPAIRNLLAEMLEGRVSKLIAAQDAAAALKLARSSQQRVDLVLTETNPSGMPIHELAKSLYQVHPQLKLLFMSGCFDESFASALGDQAQRLFLLKPFSLTTLIEKIEYVLS
jgi:two-component system, cell cycle sensor histidine kinase and response regulator CckA